eukprot:GHVR01132271.1.p1 GENE.GHVR01132271.1~~GHVR01132271.1.p1  ORF type:complete len:151 (-),score=10.31 GHVR01132271.1:90-542(-)
MGLDLNRAWQYPLTVASVILPLIKPHWLVPTISATKCLLQAFAHDPRVCLDMFIDVHAHSTATNSFMYCNLLNVNNSLERVVQERIFPSLLAESCAQFSFEATKFDNDVTKAGSARRAISTSLPSVSCYTLEASFFCSQKGQSGGKTPSL